MQQIGLAFISAQVPTPFNLDHSVVFQHAKSSNSLRRVFKEVPIIKSRSASFLTWFENPTKGVCGASAAAKKTLLVEDVHEFPGHVACDDASNSELVVPVIYQVCFIIYKRMIFRSLLHFRTRWSLSWTWTAQWKKDFLKQTETFASKLWKFSRRAPTLKRLRLFMI